MHLNLKWAAICVVGFVLVSCGGHKLSKGREFSLSETSYASLSGWKNDNFREAATSIMQSCAKAKGDWVSFCNGFKRVQFDSSDTIRKYIESKLTPYEVRSYASNAGKFTGYYEAELTGTRTRVSSKQVPIYGVPYGYKNGQKIESRKQIESCEYEAPIIAWADDPVDKFILQIQGSGRMRTPTGEIRLGYAGNNGHEFKPISSIMLEEGVLQKGKGTMPDMRAWLKSHPEEARKLMAKNPRYIFFREIKGETPIGSAGVPLTPERSIAVDSSFIPMHTPVYVDTKDPDGNMIKHLVMAQDVGNAIKGGIRADYFWGHGEDAFKKAGRMNSQGRYYLLLPK